MPENEIIAEIHRTREQFARECGFDVREMGRRIRAEEAEYAAKGWKLVSFADENEPADSCILREEPPEAQP